MTIDTGTADPVSQKPYPIAINTMNGLKMKLRNYSPLK